MGLIIRLERLRALSGAFFWSEGEKTEGTRGQRGESPLGKGGCPLSVPSLSPCPLSVTCRYQSPFQ